MGPGSAYEAGYSDGADSVLTEAMRLGAENADLRARLAKAEAVVEAARKWAAGDLQYHGHTGLKHDVLAALRALDNDSGGSDAC